MAKYRFIYVLFFTLTACSTGLDYSPDNIEYEAVPKYQQGEPIWYQKNRLYRAYVENSDDLLQDFFTAWAYQSSITTKADLKILPVAIAHTYRIYEDFYQPHNVARIAKLEQGTDLLSQTAFFITQPSIDILVTDQLPKKIGLSHLSDNIFYVSLRGFKPTLKGEVKPLFMDEYYQSLLEEFLGDKTLARHHQVASTSKIISESDKKQQFLNRYVNIGHSHWGGWRLVTGPTITTVHFNKTYTEAVIHFSFVYQGGKARYQFIGGQWTLLSSILI